MYFVLENDGQNKALPKEVAEISTKSAAKL